MQKTIESIGYKIGNETKYVDIKRWIYKDIPEIPPDTKALGEGVYVYADNGSSWKYEKTSESDFIDSIYTKSELDKNNGDHIEVQKESQNIKNLHLWKNTTEQTKVTVDTKD
jgi:hypothetical protein